MIFEKDENLVSQRFSETFVDKIKLFAEELDLLANIISTSRTKVDEFNKYSVLLLAGLNLKGLIGAYDRLSKGYLADCETLFKRVIEALMAQIYLDVNTNEAKEWCNNKLKLGSLEKDRYKLAKKLDELNKEHKFFKTNMDDFFTEEIYRVGYKNACSIAHMDFESVHTEMGAETGDPTKFATILMLCPSYNENFMKISLNRLVMFTLFQTTYLADAVGYTDRDRVDSVFNKVIVMFSD